MPSTASVLAFVGAAAVLIAIPDPSLLFTIGRALTVGRAAALWTVVGNGFGLLVQSGLVAAGFGALVAASPLAFTVIKLVGAAYLVWLGIDAIRHRNKLQPAPPTAASPATVPAPVSSQWRGPSEAWTSARTGFTVGLTNPKTLVFLSALLPQFVDGTSTVSPAAQVAGFGALFAAMAVLGDSVWALAASGARAWFARNPRRLGQLGAVGGALMIVLGLALALATAPR